MKFPNAHRAVVERHKVVGYLLNAAHPDNNGKARFFEALGFSVDAPEGLIAAFLGIGQTGEVAETTRSAHGEKHVSRDGCRRTLGRTARGGSVRCGLSTAAASLPGS